MGLLWLAALRSAWAQTIEAIHVVPEAFEQTVLDSLPLSAGDPLAKDSVETVTRLLRATERYDAVDVVWQPEERELRIKVIPREYFEGVLWRGDVVKERFRIEQLCFLARESRAISQERISQISRCVISDLQRDGYLDASVILAPEGASLALEVLLGDVYLVDEIQIEGAENLADAKNLIRRLFTELGRPFKGEKLKRDTTFLLNQYLNQGFYFAEVFQPLIQVRADTHTVGLKWRVRPGTRFEVRFLGDFKDSKFLEELLAREEVFPTWFAEEIQDQIVSEMRSKGFLDVEVSLSKSTTTQGIQLYAFRTQKHSRYRLGAADFVGVNNQDVVLKLFQSLSDVGAGTIFNRQDFNEKVTEDLPAMLFERGYLDVEVRGVDFVIQKEKSLVRPVIYLNEGEQYRIQSCRIEGSNADLDSLEAAKDFGQACRSGLAVDEAKIESVRKDFVRGAIGLGYLDAEAVLTYEKVGNLASVTLTWKPGPRYRVSKVLVRGAVRTNERLLRLESMLKAGSYFEEELVRDGVANILRLGISRSVDIRVLEKNVKAGTLIALIEVVEGARFRFEVGPGYGTLDGVRGVFKGVYSNIGGTGRRLSLFLKANRKLEETVTPSSTEYLDPRESPFIERRLTLEYFEPRLLYFPVDGTLSFSNSKQEFPLFDETKNTFSGIIDYRVNRRILLTTQYDLEFSDPFNVKIGENITAFDDERAKTLTSVSETALLKFLDDDFNPSRGARTRMTGTVFHEVLGGDENFWQFKVKQDFYRPVFRFQKSKVLGLAVSLNFGFSDPFGVTEEIPVQKRFYVGGESSVRGFEDQAINPQGQVGGNSYSYFQSEINIPFFFGVDLLGFFDGGNLFDNNSNFEPWNLRYGAGAGLRWNTPVGPLKVGYGFNLDRHRNNGQKEPFGAFYFGVGVI